MDLSDIIPSTQEILTGLRVSNSKNLIEHIADILSKDVNLTPTEIEQALSLRERQGSTGVGLGAAIPHAKFSNLTKPCGVFFKLEKPIDYDAPDHIPVDLIFAFLMPENAVAEHLTLLARISRLIKTPGHLERLRSTQDKDVLLALIHADNIRQVA